MRPSAQSESGPSAGPPPPRGNPPVTSATLANAIDREGLALWTKFGDLKTAFGNLWRPEWNKVCPGGEVPSGKQLDELKEAFRVGLWWALAKQKEDEKSKLLAAEDKKGVGKRVAYWGPGTVDGIKGWHFGTIMKRQTTQKDAFIQWDDDPLKFLPKSTPQGEVPEWIKNAVTHQEDDERAATAPAAKARASTDVASSGAPPPEWYPQAWGAWGLFGPWSPTPALIFGGPESHGVPAGGFPKANAPASSRANQRNLDRREGDAAHDEKRLRVAKVVAASDAIRDQMALANALAARKEGIQDAKLIFDITEEGPEKDAARAGLRAALQAPVPTRESVAAAFAPPEAPAPEAPAAQSAAPNTGAGDAAASKEDASDALW